jgi:4-amino-4-deoxy-L-arabinose transferase-like glycosyltransferase
MQRLPVHPAEGALRRHPRARAGDLAWLLAIAGVLLLVHVLLNGRYGFHRDELQVLDDARRLDWGYVPYPPLTPFLGRIELVLFGTSLAGFRVLAAVAQCLVVVIAGLLARELGGSRLAQVTAALATAVAPFSLLAGSQFQYVAFDGLWWMLVAWLAARLAAGAGARAWLALGVVAGLGLLTRYTILAVLAGFAVGCLATPLRRDLRSPWPWAAALVALAMFAPHLLWQWQHGFVTLEFLQHIHARDVRIGRADGFLLQQLYVPASPLTLPLWLAGLGFVAFSDAGRRFRILAWLYLVPLAAFVLAQARGYYLAPAYPMLLAAGGVAAERGLARLGEGARRSVLAVGTLVLALAAASGALVALPIAPVNSAGWHASRRFHDNFAEQVGWPERVAQVAAIYHALPEAERARTGILAGNYGEAGAIDLYGPALGLPRAISGVNTYWYLGPGDPPPSTLIVLGADAADIARAPARCASAGRVANAAGVENEETRGDPQVYVCRDLRVPLRTFWPKLRGFG